MAERDEFKKWETNPDNPWPGLAPFTEEAHHFFYGREEELSELLRRVKRKSFTLLFGQSGLGKTSLLQAGLFPRLRQEHFLPVYVRVDFAPGALAPVEQLRARIEQAISAAGLDHEPEPEPKSLWEYFHRRGSDLRTAEGHLLSLVLVLDQFEEMFTIGEGGKAPAGREFLVELSDLVENRLPAELEHRLERQPEAVDEFEFAKDQFRVLLSLREDYLPHLENLRVTMPSLTQNRLRLNRMTGRQAVDAVLKPGGDLVSPEVAQKIVRFVSGEQREETEDLTSVEPSLLSLVCHELNNKRRQLGQKSITADLLAGSSDAILQDFYERCLDGQPGSVRAFIEEELLTDSGFRENIALERAQKLLEQRGGSPRAVDHLVDLRLLHVEERLNVRRVELTHDISSIP